MTYIIFAGLLQAAISLLLLLTSKRKEQADSLLMLLLAGIGWHLTTKFYIFTVLANSSVSTLMHTFIQLSYGPLLYLYAEKKKDNLYIVSARWYLFVPLIMSIALYLSVIIAYTWYPANGKFMLDIYNMMVFPLVLGAHFIFGIVILVKNKKNNFADYPLIRTSSLLLLGLGLAELFLTYAAKEALQYSLVARSIIYSLLGTMPVLVIRQKLLSATNGREYNFKPYTPTYQVAPFFLQIPGSLAMPVDNLPRKLLLEPAQHLEVFTKIESVIKGNQLFKEESISLEKVAVMLGVSRHCVSETLNVFAKKSFYQYINECRIEEVLKVLADRQENESLLSIAYRSGFKNKSSFNAYFKRITGSTPSAYLKAQEIAC